MRRMGALVVGILLAVASAASAQEACRAEMDKFCKDVKMGGGRVIKCLQGHDAQLSDACRARLNTMRQFMACLDDVVQLCPHVEPVGGPAIECLRLHETDLSTECKNEIRALRSQ